MNENPVTRLPRSFLQLGPGSASGPPKVPTSRITPFCQMNVCIGPPRNENGSGVVLILENPITCPPSRSTG
jgi:hypothetical protein